MIWDLKLPLAELKRRDRVRGTGVLLDPVYTISGKFLNGQKLTRIHLSLTRDPRNLASFWTANSTVICYRICGVPYKLVAQVKNSSFQKFDRTRVNRRVLISRTEHKRLLQISCYLVILVNFVSLLKVGPLRFVFLFFFFQLNKLFTWTCFFLACSRLSDSGEDAKVKGTRKVGGEKLFSSSRFLNSTGPTISEPGTG